MPSSITLRRVSTGATEVLLLAPTVVTGDLIAWDYPCDLISPRETEIVVVVNNGAALPGDATLLWDFQITAPTRGGAADGP